MKVSTKGIFGSATLNIKASVVLREAYIPKELSPSQRKRAERQLQLILGHFAALLASPPNYFDRFIAVLEENGLKLAREMLPIARDLHADLQRKQAEKN